MFFVFLLRYRNPRGNLEELEKVVDTARVPTAFLIFLNFHSCSYNSTEIRYMFSISWLFAHIECVLLNAICLHFFVSLFVETNKVLQSHSCRIHFKLFFCRLFFRQRNFKYGKFGTQYKQITVVSIETPFIVTCQENFIVVNCKH